MPVRVETIHETGSTNADLLARLADGEAVAEGYWLVADRQNAGRGRQGRSWFDGPGNFMGSTVVRLDAASPVPASLSFVAALAVYETVTAYLAVPESLRLKWPNDLLLYGAKLGGILLERSGAVAVIGIGVNLAWAPVLEGRATGQLRTLGPAPDRDLFARNLATAFDIELDRWRQFGLEPLFARWQSAAHPLGTPLAVHGTDGSRLAGAFDGLEPDGALRLRLADGTCRVIHAGDVTIEEK